MSETKQIRMLDTVEDANSWPVEDDSGRVTMRHTQDRLQKGETYELPARQARKLINQGHAEAV